MIRLIEKGKAIYLNPHHIVAVTQFDPRDAEESEEEFPTAKATVEVFGGAYFVDELPSVIVGMIDRPGTTKADQEARSYRPLSA